MLKFLFNNGLSFKSPNDPIYCQAVDVAYKNNNINVINELINYMKI